MTGGEYREEYMGLGVAKVIELLADGKDIESAVATGVAEAKKSIRNVSGVWVDGIQALLDDGEITGYRVNLKITFVVDNNPDD